MKTLFNRVVKGTYPRIPSHFSKDLSNIIEALLAVDPDVRPSADDIIGMSVFHKRRVDIHVEESSEDELL